MSAITTLLVGLVASWPIVSGPAWPGGHDIRRFLFWSVLLSLATVPLARAVESRATRSARDIALSVGIGLLGGVVWCQIATFPYGWFRAPSLSLLLSWPFLVWPFAAAAGISSAIASRSTGKPFVGTVMVVALLTACPLAITESAPYVAGWQVLTVIKMKIVGPSADLEILNPSYLTHNDVELLERSGILGRVEIVSTSTIGRLGPPARALVVSNHPLEQTVTVNQPRGVSAVYLQSRDRVDIFPSDTPLHRWRLRFETRAGGKFEKSIDVVQEYRGGWSGGGLIPW
jgi:hypothetical protein